MNPDSPTNYGFAMSPGTTDAFMLAGGVAGSSSLPAGSNMLRPSTSRGGTTTYGNPRVSAFTRVQLLANRLIYTRAYAVLYFSCMVLNLILLIWGASHFAYLRSSSIKGGDVPAWYAVLDVFAALLLVAEVLVRVAASPRQFFSSLLNVADALVLSLSFMALFLYSLDPGVIVAEAVILIIRYGAQLFRTYLILKHHFERNTRLKAMNDNQIDFNIIPTDEFQEESIHLVGRESLHDSLDDDEQFRVTHVGL
eukprot:TRINITY_DN10124_c0_g1_i1.p1 TRINITY_DN10124_c0_g1~~TRINITY_DN10124_c0_g1_i1.p1  ORF type:complete len:286 (-),score=54.00 TRINITY_DN10124_c0_g1_i1:1051-1806(-)